MSIYYATLHSSRWFSDYLCAKLSHVFFPDELCWLNGSSCTYSTVSFDNPWTEWQISINHWVHTNFPKLIKPCSQFFQKSKICWKINVCHVMRNSCITMQVILTDGDASTLTNMKENMELNNLCIEEGNSKLIEESKNKVRQFPHWIRGLCPDVLSLSL